MVHDGEACNPEVISGEASCEKKKGQNDTDICMQEFVGRNTRTYASRASEKGQDDVNMVCRNS